jgi:hypothetical protein
LSVFSRHEGNRFPIPLFVFYEIGCFTAAYKQARLDEAEAKKEGEDAQSATEARDKVWFEQCK